MMKNHDLQFSSGGMAVRRLGFRAFALLAAFGALLVLVVLNPGVAQAQLDFRQLFIAILSAILEAFRNSPFFGFIRGIIEALIASFGGTISG